MSWKPVFHDRRAALQVAEEITSAVRGLMIGGSPPGRTRQAVDSALLFSVADTVWPGQGYSEVAERAFEGAVDSGAPSMSLFGGYTGLAWVLGYAARESDDDPNEDFDGQLLEFLIADNPCRGEYDLIGGLVGVGVYALERVHRPLGAQCIERIVDLLAASAVARDNGMAWFTPPDRMLSWQRVQSPNGNWNVGLAHGAPGAMPFLARAAIAPVDADTRRKAAALLDGVVGWVLAQKAREAHGHGWFPGTIQDGVPSGGRVPAWCYGDLGIAAALLVTARAAGRSDWEAEAVSIARGAAGVPGAGAVIDAGLCHGAAGVGHIFNRMYQTTGDPILGDAARRWIEKTLDLRTGEGIGGYQAWVADLQAARTDDKWPTPQWMNDASFLEGSTGVALALIAAATDIEPAWDRLLLVSGAPIP